MPTPVTSTPETYARARRNDVKSAMLEKQRRMKPMVDFLRSLNDRHREELGDFLCFCEEQNAGAEQLDDDARDRGGIPRWLWEKENWLRNTLSFPSGEHGILMLNFRNNALPSTTHLGDERGEKLKGFLRQAQKDDNATAFTCIASIVHSLPSTWKARIDISRNNLGGRDAVAACEAFKGLPPIIELDMSYNLISDEGGRAIFTTLLGHPSCRIQRLNLEWNWSLELSLGSYMVDAPPRTDEFFRFLRQNQSLTELDLSGTLALHSFAIANEVYDFSDACRLLDIPDRYNHNLQTLTLGADEPIAEYKALQAALEMNEGGPEAAVARKIDHYLSKGYDEIFSGGGHHVSRCLEVVGKHGSDTALYELAKRYLFGTSCGLQL